MTTSTPSAATAAPPAARSPLGVEFVTWPLGVVDVAPFAYDAWTAANGTAATLDCDGWPTEDAYSVLFDYAPSPLDPAAFVPPGVFGAYTFRFAGKGTVTIDPLDAAHRIENVTFDAASWTTTGVVALDPSAVPGFAIGVFGSQRNASAAVGSGFTRMQVLQPGYTFADVAAGAFFVRELAPALAPFGHVRTHEWSGTNDVPLPYPATAAWSDRRLLTDARWASGAGGKPLAVGAPWETALLLSHAANDTSLWINVPVYATGSDPADETSFVFQLATLLRDGSAATGGRGLAAGTALFVEHGNELWLNTSSLVYAYNRAAAIAEVAAGGSVLNNDGSTDPEAWARRRHAKRLHEIAAIFAAVFIGSTVEVRPVLAWFQLYSDDARAMLSWYEATFGAGAARRTFFAYAINSYRVPVIPAGSTPADVFDALLAASDAALPSRQASAAVAADFGLLLASYEGSGWAQAADNATLTVILEANRLPGIASCQRYDYLANWVVLPGAGAYNFYSLSSGAGLNNFGLAEDLLNVTAFAKYEGVLGLVPAAPVAVSH